MADEDDMQEVVRSHRERFGRLDVLVNNAGVGIGEAVAEIDTKKVDLQLDINLRSTSSSTASASSCCAPRAPSTAARSWSTPSSISGKSGEAWLSVYSATKAASSASRRR